MCAVGGRLGEGRGKHLGWKVGAFLFRETRERERELVMYLIYRIPPKLFTGDLLSQRFISSINLHTHARHV